MSENSDKNNENTDALLDKFKNADSANEWFIAINTVPVKREEIVDGFLDKLGMNGENSFVYGLIKAIAPMLPDTFFDSIAEKFFGGGANHTYITVCEVVDGKTIVRENLEAMGLEYKDGKPVLSGKGELIPVIRNDETNPLHAVKANNTTQSVTILKGDKDKIYQGYSTMLKTANKVFEKPVEYNYTKENCNAFTAENLANIGALSPEHKKLGAGMDENTFETQIEQTTSTGETLMKEVEQEKQKLDSIFTAKMSPSHTPEPKIAENAPVTL